MKEPDKQDDPSSSEAETPPELHQPSPHRKTSEEKRQPLAATQQHADGGTLPETNDTVQIQSPPNLPEISEEEQKHRPRRLVPLLLFLATCASTFFAGATDWEPVVFVTKIIEGHPDLTLHWKNGMLYMAAVLLILLTHEMGHFLTTLLYKIRASYPLFIPIPINAFGTMGAVISMDGMKANRKQLFDLGLSGPLAGLVIAIPVYWIGIERLDLSGPAGPISFHNPWIGEIFVSFLRPDISPNSTIGIRQLNPFFMAGWVGMLITGLNMLPISQLDGGHAIYAMFGKKAHLIARAFLLMAIAYIIIDDRIIWVLMVVLITFLGTDHPPSSDDSVKLGPVRWVIGIASLAIPILCFTPQGFEY